MKNSIQIVLLRLYTMFSQFRLLTTIMIVRDFTTSK